jgi:hypothetical protein
MIPGFLAPQGPEKFSPKLLSSLFRRVALLVVVMFPAMALLVGVARKILAAGTKFIQTSKAGPWWVLSVCPVAVTTKVEEDVDGGPPGGAIGISGSGHH